MVLYILKGLNEKATNNSSIRYNIMLFARKILIVLMLVSVFLTSCNTKKDCRGRTKHRLPNGIWM